MTYAKNAVSSLASSQTPKDRKKSICLISRQRLVAGTTGSSRYVLSLMKTLQKAGYDIHLIHPSPNVFGRMPLMVGAKGLSPFKSVSVRGGIVVGRFIIALNIGVFAGFVRGACAVAARKFGITLPDQPAPYSVSAPWVAKDYVFLSKHSRAKTDTVICDYAFQTDALAYMARLDAKSFVIMHDLISSRQEQFSRIQQTDTLPSITEREELRLLTGADAIIAIQEDEAAYIRARAAGHTVVCAPVAFETASLAHPGDPSMLLFVGSKTPPNEIGLNWFLRDVWPLLHAQSPCLKLIVAGSVCRSIGAVPANVELRGTVRDLQPLYEAAGVVISPLLAGSGLKIKLIEALSYGKAIVSTLPTVQGVKAIVEDAVMIADDSHAFARAIITLIRDDDLRAHKANRALDIAQKNFTADVCYQEMLGLFNAPALKSSNLPRIENDQDFALDDSAQIERA